ARGLQGGAALQIVHGSEDHVGRVLDTVIGVKHHVVKTAAGPLRVEILADEGRALAIDRVDILGCIFLAHLQPNEAADFLLARAIDKNAEGVLARTEDIGGAAAYDDTVALFGFALDDLLRVMHQLVGVEDLVVGDGQRALVAAAPEDLRETMKQRVALLFPARDGVLIDPCDFGDIAGELLVEQLPTLAARQFSGDKAAARAVFAFNGDDPEHAHP